MASEKELDSLRFICQNKDAEIRSQATGKLSSKYDYLLAMKFGNMALRLSNAVDLCFYGIRENQEAVLASEP